MVTTMSSVSAKGNGAKYCKKRAATRRKMKILITGGAGFIGTHLTRDLLLKGHEITILDNFLPQVHAGICALPADIAGHVELITGDVTDIDKLNRALSKAETVVHLAAETGTGQSMYEVCHYERTNVGGSAALYECLARNPSSRVERIIVASSRAIYGEGAYRCQTDGIVYPGSRSSNDKRRGQFDPLCPVCSAGCNPVPTPEDAPLSPSSFYGLTKQVQEQMALLFGRTLQIPTFALRYQNVYGPGQSLNNPYTGILAILSNLARTGQNLNIFEDGAETRDFVHVADVVQATAACLLTEIGGHHFLNVGSSQRTSVLEVANQINAFFGSKSKVEISGAFREGDIRHGMADLTAIHRLLGYEPKWRFIEGLRTFLQWAADFAPNLTGYVESLAEMKKRALLHQQD